MLIFPHENLIFPLLPPSRIMVVYTPIPVGPPSASGQSPLSDPEPGMMPAERGRREGSSAGTVQVFPGTFSAVLRADCRASPEYIVLSLQTNNASYLLKDTCSSVPSSSVSILNIYPPDGCR